ncbi:MAG: calcium/sodium antiporter [Bdellovibrionales bacterium]|nr:calcium/sodium antiporter [Bdellovibrionales bacterium]
MLIYSVFVAIGLILLVLSADKFVSGSTSVAKHYGMPPLLIGMVIVGFGTSAPEMVVSALAALEGSPGIALGNAYGSNITNIALILGVTALYMPIVVHSKVLKKELPILTAVTVLSTGLLLDLQISRLDAVILLFLFLVLTIWSIKQGLSQPKDSFAKEIQIELELESTSIKKSYLYLVVGLIVLIISSRMLVYGAVGIANFFGVSDIIIGLTVVAIGTSLPELASSIIAAKKGEPDIALGNILGSNLFNTLAVVGIAGVIQPLSLDVEVLKRDLLVMILLTTSLFLFGYGFKKTGRINRVEGGALLLSFMIYSAFLISSQI